MQNEPIDYRAEIGRFNPSLILPIVHTDRLALLKGSDKEIETSGTVFHERVHLVQTLMTAHGMAYWFLRRELNHATLMRWKEWTEGQAWRLVPFSALAAAQQMHRQDIGHFLDHATDLLLCASARLGLPKIDPFDGPVPNSQDLRLSDLSTKPEPFELYPTITINKMRWVLLPRHLAEAQAAWLEALYMGVMNHWTLEELSEYYNQRFSNEYVVPYIYFKEQLGIERVTEFPVVCDLAFMSHEWKGVIPRTREEWEKSDPAWRFVRFVQALKAGTAMPVPNSPQFRESFNQYANALTTHCGYESHDRILTKVVNLMRTRPESFMHKYFLDAFMLRSKYPWGPSNPLLRESRKEIYEKMATPVLGTSHDIVAQQTAYDDLFQIPREEGVVPIVLLATWYGLHIEALADQIRGTSSDVPRKAGKLSCGFAHFGFDRACPYQENGKCDGKFDPAMGSPVPVSRNGRLMRGCSFEMALEEYKIDIREIRVLG